MNIIKLASYEVAAVNGGNVSSWVKSALNEKGPAIIGTLGFISGVALGVNSAFAAKNNRIATIIKVATYGCGGSILGHFAGDLLAAYGVFNKISKVGEVAISSFSVNNA